MKEPLKVKYLKVKPGQVWRYHYKEASAFIVIVTEINYQNNCCDVIHENGNVGSKLIDHWFFVNHSLVFEPEVFP